MDMKRKPTMRLAAARAHVRQLCSLGLGEPAILPELLRAVSTVISSGPNVFEAVTSGYEKTAYVVLERPQPDLLDLFYRDLNGAFRQEMDAHRNWWRRNSTRRVCSDVKEMFGDRYFYSDFYHQICRPLDQHHLVSSLICEGNRPLGLLHLYRAEREPPFSERETRDLAGLLPHVAHGMTVREQWSDSFVDSGRSARLIIDACGRLTHHSETAAQLLYIASRSGMIPSPTSGSLSSAELLKRLAGYVCTIARGQEAPPAVILRQNTWGRFVFRAYRLDDAEQLQSALILVTIEHQEPLRLRLARGLDRLCLSGKERQLCLWLAQCQSIPEVARRLGIKADTAKKYADASYRKLDVHNREELRHKILAEGRRIPRRHGRMQLPSPFPDGAVL
jgi:DNA-binding CsgD family transcriptional regulator